MRDLWLVIISFATSILIVLWLFVPSDSDGPTLIAIFVGPIFAVLLTRTIDRVREDRKRKLEIFRDLIAYRGKPMFHQFIRALNLVEIEFDGDKKVLGAWNQYIVRVRKGPQDDEPDTEFIDDTRILRTNLLREIASRLNIQAKSLDEHSIGYFPEKFEISDYHESKIRESLLHIIHKKEAIPIRIENLPETQRKKKKNIKPKKTSMKKSRN